MCKARCKNIFFHLIEWSKKATFEDHSSTHYMRKGKALIDVHVESVML